MHTYGFSDAGFLIIRIKMWPLCEEPCQAKLKYIMCVHIWQNISRDEMNGSSLGIKKTQKTQTQRDKYKNKWKQNKTQTNILDVLSII